MFSIIKYLSIVLLSTSQTLFVFANDYSSCDYMPAGTIICEEECSSVYYTCDVNGNYKNGIEKVLLEEGYCLDGAIVSADECMEDYWTETSPSMSPVVTDYLEEYDNEEDDNEEDDSEEDDCEEDDCDNGYKNAENKDVDNNNDEDNANESGDSDKTTNSGTAKEQTSKPVTENDKDISGGSDSNNVAEEGSSSNTEENTSLSAPAVAGITVASVAVTAGLVGGVYYATTATSTSYGPLLA